MEIHQFIGMIHSMYATVMHMSDEQQHERKACTLNTLLGIFERFARERGKAAVPAAEGQQTTEDAATWHVAESV